MKKKDIFIGSCYAAKVSGKMVPIRIDGVSQYGGWFATNLNTHRVVHIKTAARLRYALCPECYGPLATTAPHDCAGRKESAHA